MNEFGQSRWGGSAVAYNISFASFCLAVKKFAEAEHANDVGDNGGGGIHIWMLSFCD